MRAILVNHCHPETQHVCAVRAREFAGALARRGHGITLLTETLSPEDPAETPDALRGRLADHDWSKPLILACRPSGHAFLRRQRTGDLPAPLGRLTVAGYYAAAGSVFCDWGRGAAPYVPVLADIFKPDIVWATFGNTESLRIAQRIAAASGCPWIFDVKDYWSAFLPRPVRIAVARRYRDAAAMTALSQGHVRDIAPFVPGTPTVIYSGIPDTHIPAPETAPDANRIVLSGAVYDTGHLRTLIDGVSAWSRGRAAIDYAGHEGALVAAAIARRPGIAAFTDHGYIPLPALHRLQAGALANAFIRSGPGWFQHKVPELLSARRPIISLPESDAESVGLAGRAGIPFFNCATAAHVAEALAAARDGAPIRPDSDFLASFSWDSRAEALEKVMLSAIR